MFRDGAPKGSDHQLPNRSWVKFCRGIPQEVPATPGWFTPPESLRKRLWLMFIPRYSVPQYPLRTDFFFSRSTRSIRTLRLSDRTPDDPKGRELCYWMRSLQIFDHTPDEPNGSELCAIRPRHVRYHRNIADVARSPGHTGAIPHRGDRPFSIHVTWSLAR